MIIVISGSVGCGKTTLSKILSLDLNFELIHLNKIAKKFKSKNLKNNDFEFDEKKLFKNLKIDKTKNLILESHFAHLLNPKDIDLCFIINRDLKELKKEYEKREYDNKKTRKNLDCEIFDICYLEAIENKILKSKIKKINNSNLEKTVNKIKKIILKKIK